MRAWTNLSVEQFWDTLNTASKMIWDTQSAAVMSRPNEHGHALIELHDHWFDNCPVVHNGADMIQRKKPESYWDEGERMYVWRGRPEVEDHNALVVWGRDQVYRLVPCWYLVEYLITFASIVKPERSTDEADF